VIKTTLAEAPACGIGINKSISGSKMTISTRTLSSVKQRASSAWPFTSRKTACSTIRTAIQNRCTTTCSALRSQSRDETGKVLVNGTVEKGQAFDNTFTFDIPSDYVKNNLHVIAVVYQLDPSSSATKPLAVLNVNNI